MKLNQAISQEIARLVEATPEARWHNAFAALSYLPEAQYVEGWAVNLESFEALEHAWLVQAGQIIDPTCWENEMAYFPGQHFTLAQAQARFAGRNSLPLVYRPGWSEPNSPAASDAPAYWDAWEAASKFAERRKRTHLWRAWRRWITLLHERKP